MGHDGEVRVRYQRAARLADWELVQDTDRLGVSYVMRARVVSTHDYWFQQQPQDLVLWLGQTAWTWQNVTFTRNGDHLVAVIENRPTVTAGAAV